MPRPRRLGRSPSHSTTIWSWSIGRVAPACRASADRFPGAHPGGQGRLLRIAPFPRLLVIDKLKETIARGVANGMLAYLGKTPDGRCDPFFFEQSIEPAEVEFSDEMFIVTAEEARMSIEPPALKYIDVRPDPASVEPGKSVTFTYKGLDQHGQEYRMEAVSWSATGGEIGADGVFRAGEEEGDYTITRSPPSRGREDDSTSGGNRIVKPTIVDPTPVEPVRLTWAGQVPPQKWMHFYTKVLAKFVNVGDLSVSVSASPKGGISPNQVEETKSALRDLGLSPDVSTGPSRG